MDPVTDERAVIRRCLREYVDVRYINGDIHNATVIDPVKEAVVKNIDLGGAVEFPAVDGQGMLYDNNEEKSEVVAIDTRTLTGFPLCL